MDLTVSVQAAMVAGIISFLSPCVLPLVPSYLCFITGASLDELAEQNDAANHQSKEALYSQR